VGKSERIPRVIPRDGSFQRTHTWDGSLLRYTELWKIKGPQKAKLKKGWVELEIGVPQSRWQNDSVERYKKHLAQAIEEALHSMIELLKKKHQEVDAETLLADWKKIRDDFLSGSSD
jgi:hypothetical protein